jgi:nitrate reductase NapAB chaperone NapD
MSWLVTREGRAMWISSLVLTFASAASAQAAMVALQAFSTMTPGELYGVRLPVVIEAADGPTARYWHEWLQQLPGVQHVELAFVGFDESDRKSSSTAPG